MACLIREQILVISPGAGVKDGRNAGVKSRSSAHWAGLCAGVKNTSTQVRGVQMLCCRSDGVDFGMRRWVTITNAGVETFGDDLTIFDHHSSKWFESSVLIKALRHGFESQDHRTIG